VPTQYVDGAWVAGSGGGRREIVNPADGSVVATVAEGTSADTHRAIAAARKSFDAGDWAFGPVQERVAVLNRIADLLAADRAAVARLETLDTGKTLRESEDDVDDVVAVFRYYAGLGDKDGGRVVAAASPTVSSRIVYEPVGVCGLIAPWNYPLLQVSWKLAPALVAGNTVVVKPSEVTPLTTIRLVEMLEQAGVPAGVVNLVLGSGPVVGAPLAESPDVDLVSFTGGLATGQTLMRAAAGNVKKVALELGGKNPNIVFADADLEAALDNALTAAFLHSGQVCSAGARLLVEDEIHDDFVAELGRRAERIHLGDGLDPASESGPLVSSAHRDKIEGYVRLGLAEGARLVAGGRRPEEADLQGGFFYRPTVFADCRRDMRIVQEEVFGPVVTVERFRTEDEAVALGNDTAYGLAGAVWTSDTGRARRVSGRLRHGTVWVNDYGPYLPQAEWGGFGRSGIGRELGPAGLAEYREAKHIYENTEPAPARWFAG
jgi:betaine-aldehyde dehydrogenase